MVPKVWFVALCCFASSTKTSHAADDAEKKRIAYLIFGSSHQGRATSGHDVPICTDADRRWQSSAAVWTRSASDALKTFVLEPLSEIATVDVFLAVDSCAPDYDGVFRSLYAPYEKGAVFMDAKLSRKTKFRAVTNLALLDSYDSIVLSRPDLLWSASPSNVTSFFFPPPDVIAWPHRCEPEAWDKWQCVSDAIIVIPGGLVQNFFSSCDEALYIKFLQSAHWSYNCAVSEKVIADESKALFLFGDVQIKINSRGMPVREVPVPFYLPDYSQYRQEKLDLAKQNAQTHKKFRHVGGTKFAKAILGADRSQKEEEEAYSKEVEEGRDYSGTLLGRRASLAHGIVYVRVPKTGSNSVRSTVIHVCEAGGVYDARTGLLTDNPNLVSARANEYKDREPLSGYRCAYQHVHFGTWLYAAFPSMAQSLLVSVVREPASWATSVLNNREGFCGHLATDRRKKIPTILELGEVCELARRGQYGYLGGGRRFFDSVYLRTPADVVDFYDAILVLDRLSASLVALLAARQQRSLLDGLTAFPLCTFRYETLNRNDDPEYRAFNSTINDEYNRRHANDVQVYNLANDRLDAAIEQLGQLSFTTLLNQYELSCLTQEDRAFSKRRTERGRRRSLLRARRRRSD